MTTHMFSPLDTPPLSIDPTHTVLTRYTSTPHVPHSSHPSPTHTPHLLVMLQLDGGPTLDNLQGVPPTLDQDLCNTSMGIQEIHRSVALWVVIGGVDVVVIHGGHVVVVVIVILCGGDCAVVIVAMQMQEVIMMVVDATGGY